MENGTVGMVDAREVDIADSLVDEPQTAGRCDTREAMSWVETASSNNYNNDNSDDDVLTSVLTQVRHAYILPPATSAHGTI